MKCVRLFIGVCIFLGILFPYQVEKGVNQAWIPIVIGIGMAAAAIASAVASGVSAHQSHQNLKYQKQMNREQWLREDTAVNRRTADLRAAGLSPTLAAGTAADAGPVVRTEPVKYDFAGEQLMNVAMSLAGIQRSMAETDWIMTQKQNAEMALPYQLAQMEQQTERMRLLLPAERAQMFASAQHSLASSAQMRHNLMLSEESGTATNPSIIGGLVRDLVGSVLRTKGPVQAAPSHNKVNVIPQNQIQRLLKQVPNNPFMSHPYSDSLDRILNQNKIRR